MSFLVLTGNGILSTQEYGPRTTALSGDHAKAVISQKVRGGKNHMNNLGYPESLIISLPDWFLISPKLTLAVERLIQSHCDGNPIPRELEPLVRWSATSPPNGANYRKRMHSQDSNPHELSAFGETLKAAIVKKRKL